MVGKHAIVFCLLLASGTLFGAEEKAGRWYGDFSLRGGTNFHSGKEIGYDKFTKWLGNFSGKLEYQAYRWRFNVDMGNNYDRTITLTDALTYDIKSEKQYSVYADENVRQGSKNNSFLGLSTDLFVSKSNRFSAYYRIDSNIEHPVKYVASTSTNSLEEIPDVDTLKYHHTWEESEIIKSSHSFGVGWRHQFFEPSKTLELKIDAKFGREDKTTEWVMGNSKKDHFDSERHYRETPHYRSRMFDVKSIYGDREFVGVENLDVSFLLDAYFNLNYDDLEAANYINEKWVDSLRFREHFEFTSLTVDPRIRAKYKVGNFSFAGEYCPEYYVYKLSSDVFAGSMTTDKLAHLSSLNISYCPSVHHIIALNASTTIKRPTYLNLCWFRRSGAYANEFIEGNKDLRPETTRKLFLEYKFLWERFTSIASVGNTYAYDKIEKTFYNEDIDGGSYRINTWINAGWSNTFNGIFSARWNGNALFAELTGKLNQAFNVNKDGMEKKNLDYRIDGQVKYKINDWNFSLKGSYQSEIIRMYSSQTQYVGLNVRVDRQIGKFGLFLEGQDLFDQAIETKTFSEDYSHGRLETKYNTLRLFVLGVRFMFKL